MAVLHALTTACLGYQPACEARFAGVESMENGILSRGPGWLGIVYTFWGNVFCVVSISIPCHSPVGAECGSVLPLWGLWKIPGRFCGWYVDQCLLCIFTQRC